MSEIERSRAGEPIPLSDNKIAKQLYNSADEVIGVWIRDRNGDETIVFAGKEMENLHNLLGGILRS